MAGIFFSKEKKQEAGAIRKSHINENAEIIMTSDAEMNMISDNMWKSENEVQASGIVKELEIGRIIPNPDQPRKVFADDALFTLADSIRRHGIIQPLVVRQIESGIYLLVAGERRLRASRLIGLEHVPCIISGVDEQQAAEVSIIENLQREDLDMFEEAAAISTLSKSAGLTQEEIAVRLSCSQSYVANKLRLLKLTEEERGIIRDKGLTERHARALIRLKDEGERLAAARKIADRHMNVAAAEEYIDKLICDKEKLNKDEKDKEKSVHKKQIKPVIKDMRLFYNSIDRAVEVVKQAGVNIISDRTETDEYINITISVPKNPRAAV